MLLDESTEAKRHVEKVLDWAMKQQKWILPTSWSDVCLSFYASSAALWHAWGNSIAFPLSHLESTILAEIYDFAWNTVGLSLPVNFVSILKHLKALQHGCKIQTSSYYTSWPLGETRFPSPPPFYFHMQKWPAAHPARWEGNDFAVTSSVVAHAINRSQKAKVHHVFRERCIVQVADKMFSHSFLCPPCAFSPLCSR